MIRASVGRFAALLIGALLLSSACVPPDTPCSERDISSWTPATFEWSTPVRCGDKLVGYRLDIDASDGTSRVWEMVNLDAADAGGQVRIRADIDLLTPVERSVRIEQGAMKLAEQTGAALTTVSATGIALAGGGTVLRAVRVIVPGKMHYRGEIRAVDWK